MVSARDTLSFARVVDGVHSFSSAKVFLFRTAIVGVDIDLFDKCLQFTIVTYFYQFKQFSNNLLSTM